jgi:hypothetical protein
MKEHVFIPKYKKRKKGLFEEVMEEYNKLKELEKLNKKEKKKKKSIYDRDIEI